MNAPSFTPLIASHAAVAIAALLLGTAVLLRRKGDTLHRTMGWLWVLLMAFVALGSFGIRDSGGFSWIHGLSAYTLVMLVWAVSLARRRQVRAHRRAMQGLYFGALVIAGLFTLLPQRRLGLWLWG